MHGNRTDSDGFFCLPDIGILSPVGVVAKIACVSENFFIFALLLQLKTHGHPVVYFAGY